MTIFKIKMSMCFSFVIIMLCGYVYAGQIQNGIEEQNYKTGELWIERTIKDGKLEGPTKEYYKNGDLKGEWTYLDNKLQGRGRTYYQGGRLELESNFKDDKNHGDYKEYYKNGKIKTEEYYQNGLLENLCRNYYETGDIKFEGTYSGDKLQGLVRNFYRGAHIETEANFKDDNINGVAKKYYIDGGIKTEEQYVNGLLSGLSKEYYSNGQLKSEGRNEEGLPRGIFTYYYANGKLMEKVNKEDKFAYLISWIFFFGGLVAAIIVSLLQKKILTKEKYSLKILLQTLFCIFLFLVAFCLSFAGWKFAIFIGIPFGIISGLAGVRFKETYYKDIKNASSPKEVKKIFKQSPFHKWDKLLDALITIVSAATAYSLVRDDALFIASFVFGVYLFNFFMGYLLQIPFYKKISGKYDPIH